MFPKAFFIPVAGWGI